MTLSAPLLLALLAPAQAQATFDDEGSDDAPVFVTDEQAIINGEDATVDDYPMAGGMIMDAHLEMGGRGGDVRVFVCSSTLIAPDVVLLAAHCLDDYAFTYGYGDISDKVIHWSREADLSDHDGSRIASLPEDAVEAWDWVAHPEFDLRGMGAGLSENFDVALLFLDEPVTGVPYAYLPTPDEALLLEEGMDLAVVGWGQQVATGTWEQPPAGTYGFKQMGMSHLSMLDDAEFKVGEEETDVRKCHGDSGGPSFAWFPNETYAEVMRVVGVTSHAYDNSDCYETGGVDTRVDFYLDWIDAEMRARCEDGTRAWCEVPGILEPPLAEVEEPEGEEPGGDEKTRRLSCSSAPAQPAPLALGLALLGLVGLARRRR